MSGSNENPTKTTEDIQAAVLAERERIAAALDHEADLAPCLEDAAVVRALAQLVRADFSYDEAERLAVDEGSIANG